MAAEDLLVHDSGDRQTVEAVGERLPQLDVEPALACGTKHHTHTVSEHFYILSVIVLLTPLTLVVEAVDAVDGGALVVPAQQEEVLGVLDLVGQQQADGLQRLLPSVHVIAQEQIVSLRREAAVLKEPQQVRVLAVDVACARGARVSIAGSHSYKLMHLH